MSSCYDFRCSRLNSLDCEALRSPAQKQRHTLIADLAVKMRDAPREAGSIFIVSYRRKAELWLSSFLRCSNSISWRISGEFPVTDRFNPGDIQVKI